MFLNGSSLKIVSGAVVVAFLSLTAMPWAMAQVAPQSDLTLRGRVTQFGIGFSPVQPGSGQGGGQQNQQQAGATARRAASAADSVDPRLATALPAAQQITQAIQVSGYAPDQILAVRVHQPKTTTAAEVTLQPQTGPVTSGRQTIGQVVVTPQAPLVKAGGNEGKTDSVMVEVIAN